ncbi:hypothetical protein PTSG_12896 [Salpingoeca rosetta]|uniref:DNA mismatch repair protein n=1 Tax=Salpingoeca rosetta (strain ATCC 50818 / BSB-021) TaxID=946362 RepID=F2UL61_SALR5|nr:uncharacterized protein PTSG_12896 [Salpingoeca rosetta]EGD77860.1 hypothetical protein PTSG_12896 [Salpingoeca rosetta]|eukprot:XP_004989924.1 hypothetical protein PTSG_12896 [Salpingoeca rosetta]
MGGNKQKQSSISRFFARKKAVAAKAKKASSTSANSSSGSSTGASKFFGGASSNGDGTNGTTSQATKPAAPLSPKITKAVDALSDFLPSTKRAKTDRASTPSKPAVAGAKPDIATSSAKRKVELSPVPEKSAKLDVHSFLRADTHKQRKSATGLPGFEVPKGAKLTPLEQQFLDVKRKHPNSVLLVEVGYKYQFFGRDAEIAADVLNIFCASGHNNFKIASIPVHRLFVHVRRLVDAGYKVGVVKQTETAALKKASANKSKPFTRKLAAMYTKGTLIGEDVDVGDDAADVNETGYLCCLCEDIKDEAGENTTVGLVAVNCTTGDLIYDEFSDDVSRAALDTRLAHISPVEVLLPKNLHSRTARLIHAFHSDGVREERLSDDHFDVTRAASVITDFFSDSPHTASPTAATPPSPSSKSTATTTSAAAKNATIVSTMLSLPPRVLACMAALLHHLKAFNLERVLALTSSLRRFTTTGREMILNACTLKNLDVLREQSTGSHQGSLLWLLDHTCTSFGRRLLRHWVARPLVSFTDIEERQRTVELFSSAFQTGADDLRSLLSGIPDIERGLLTVYSQRSSPREFHALVTAMSRVREHFVMLQAHSVLKRSSLLSKLVETVCDALETATNYVGMMKKEAAEKNDKIDLLVDCHHIFPTKRPLEEQLTTVKHELATHKRTICRTLGLNAFEYTCVSGEDYLIEVPRSRSSIVPKDWRTISATKQKVRYRSQFIHERLEVMAQCNEQLQIDAAEAWRKFMESFSASYDELRRGIKALATLDCLLSLAHTAKLPGYVKPTLLSHAPSGVGGNHAGEGCNHTSTPPDATTTTSSSSVHGGSGGGGGGGGGVQSVRGRAARKSSAPHLHIVNGRHPMVAAVLDDQFVPNSTHMDGDGVRCMVITGPNMGGKSSYIKQVALIVMMAQLGCFVPADSAELTLVTNIYTRMGASDDIERGQSTFMTELREASEALCNADTHSLVIMDELGRGTSTHDGVAIAHATLKYLIDKLRCLSLFVTHYPSLAEVTALYPQHVLCSHMSFVEQQDDDKQAMAANSALNKGAGVHDNGDNDDDDDDDDDGDDDDVAALEIITAGDTNDTTVREGATTPPPPSTSVPPSAQPPQRVLFLHQLVKGLAKKSYGLNVARLACLPESVLARATEKSHELECVVQARRRSEQQSNMELFAQALLQTEDAQSAVNLLSAIQHYKA